MLIKYSQNYNFFVFYFVSMEVGTAALKIFCVMIPSLVDTSLDFGLFRVVRPYSFYFSEIYILYCIASTLSDKFTKKWFFHRVFMNEIDNESYISGICQLYCVLLKPLFFWIFCFYSIIRHLKLILLTQFPASTDEKMLLFIENRHLSNWNNEYQDITSPTHWYQFQWYIIQI